MDPETKFEDMTTEEKIARNTERVQELQKKGMVLDPTQLRLGIMLETLLTDRGLMDQAEQRIQEKLHEELQEVERQIAQATLLAGSGAPGAAPGGNSGGMKGIAGGGMN